MRIILTFDDGYEEDFTTTYPFLKSKGIRATSYLITNDIGKKGYLSWDQVRTMAEDGWDFQCHTFTHQNLKSLSDKEIERELKLSENEFIKHSLPVPEHMAHPYGKRSDRTRSAVSKRRKSARGGVRGKGGDYDIMSYGLHGDYDIFEVKNNPLFIHTHDVSDNHRGFGVSVDYFKFIIEKLLKENATFFTVKKYYESNNNGSGFC